MNGGEDGIRTHETLLRSTPLAGERLRPLGHLSGETLDKEKRRHNQYGIRNSMLYYKENVPRQAHAPMKPIARWESPWRRARRSGDDSHLKKRDSLQSYGKSRARNVLVMPLSGSQMLRKTYPAAQIVSFVQQPFRIDDRKGCCPRNRG